MARNDRIARIFKLLDLIVRSRNGIVVATVVEKQGWKLRNVYRDLEALEKAGFPLVREGTKHRLMEGYLPAAQVGVDEEELLALHFARQQASGWQGTRVGEALGRLQGKLATPSRTTGTLLPASLGGAYTSPQLAARDFADFRDNVSMLDRAVRERLVVDATYQSISGAVTRRVIEPVQLHWDPRLEALYLIAWCRLRDDVRIFATHRFRHVASRRESFTVRPGVSSQAALRHAFRVWRDQEIVSVRLRFEGRAARLVAERRWHPSQRTRKEGDSLIFEVETAGSGEILPWILSFGVECTVLEPAELRARVRAAHAAAAAANAEPQPRARARARARS